MNNFNILSIGRLIWYLIYEAEFRPSVNAFESAFQCGQWIMEKYCVAIRFHRCVRLLTVCAHIEIQTLFIFIFIQRSHCIAFSIMYFINHSWHRAFYSQINAIVFFSFRSIFTVRGCMQYAILATCCICCQQFSPRKLPTNEIMYVHFRFQWHANWTG